MARPTDYSEEILNKTKEYLDGEWKDEGDVIPSVAGLSVFLGVARSTIYLWASQDDKREFSDTLESILSSQEKILISKGLKGEFNPTITKLALGNHHGYKEKTDITTNDKDLPTPILGNVPSDNSN